jgi:hypothetical protein
MAANLMGIVDASSAVHVRLNASPAALTRGGGADGDISALRLLPYFHRGVSATGYQHTLHACADHRHA